jgi:cytoskeletal protein RodZ
MISKTITSVAIIIAVAAMFISSGTIVNSVLAKSTSKGTDTTSSDKSTSKGTDTTSSDKSTSKGTDTTSSDTTSKGTDTTSKGTDTTSKGTDTTSKGTDTTSSDKSTSTTAEQDYKDFQKCLSDAEGTNGFATKSEIKSCFNPIYLPATTTTTTPINNDPTAFNN